MRTYISRIGTDLDARRDLLLHIKQVNPGVFYALYNHFLKDKTTLSDLEVALINTLAHFQIVLLVHPDLSLSVDYRTSGGSSIIESFDSYEAALQFAIGILHVK